MSRKYDRQTKINEGIRDVIEDPMTLFHLAGKLIRKKPKYMPLFIWKALLMIVLTPQAKTKQPITTP